MVNGCNGLLSASFGTHRLRQVTVAQTAGGVGDADFLEVTDGRLPDVLLIDSISAGNARYYYFPVVSEVVTSGQDDGPPFATSIVAWYKTGEVEPLRNLAIKGFVSVPDRLPADLGNRFATRGFSLTPSVTYLHLGERPLAWGWQLLMFSGGLLTSVLVALAAGRTSPPLIS